MIASGVICLIYVLCAIVLFCGVREQKGKALISQSNWLHPSILDAIVHSFNGLILTCIQSLDEVKTLIISGESEIIFKPIKCLV